MRKILIVGTDILNVRSSGDKNFWLDLFDNTNKEELEIQVLSINNLKGECTYNGIKFYNLNPVTFNKKSSNSPKVHKSFHRNYYEKSLTIFKLILKIRQIQKKENIELTHMIDNYGPLMFLLKPFIGKTKLSCNAIVYNPSFKFYDFFLRSSFKNMDKIIAYSTAFKKILNNWGFNNVEVIHWGVIPSKSKQKKDSSKKKILWTGNLQQTGAKEFFYSLEIAKKLISLDKEVEFTFLFKPEHFKEEYKSYSEKRIKIDKSSGKDFKNTIEEFSFLLCPILKKDSTIGPPLTWIESFDHGIPVITNYNKGCEEIIISSKNGLIYSESNKYQEILEFINTSHFEDLSFNAKEKIKRDYNLLKIARKYEHLWRQI